MPHPGDCVPVFVICDACGGVSEFDDEVVGGQLARRAEERNFILNRAVVELHGTCANCAVTMARSE